MKNIPRSDLALLATVAAVILWSSWQPHDRFTWWLEVTPGLAGLAILLATYRRFRFTTLCYTLIAIHICVLCVGGHYTYARVPLFDWLRPIFAWQRNHYDRLGHLMQGLMGLINLPGTGKHAAVFIGVGVTEHDLLLTVPGI